MIPFSKFRKKIITYYKIIVIAFISVIFSIRAIINSKKFPDGSGFYYLAQRWSELLLGILGVRLKISGVFPEKAGSYIYISNHSSLVDIPVLLFGLKDNVRIIYKKELEKIPVFGTCLRLSPFIAIEREKVRNAMDSIDRAVASVRDGVSVIVFPEGTRSKDGKVGLFKRGGFMLASRSGKPIVPVAIIGAKDIVPAGTFEINGGELELVIHPAINSGENLSKAEEINLMDTVRNNIINSLENK